MERWLGLLSHYGPLLDLPRDVSAITLHEGNTPLISAPSLARDWDASEVWIKFEGANPTGSFKDRGMTAAVSVAAHQKATTVACASTGNTAASAAAYAARAGMQCLVLIPGGKVAVGKLAGAIAYGARVVQIDGSFDDALRLVRALSESRPVTLVNSINPHRLEGQKTASFEICDALSRAPDWLALPVGNAGNITAYWMGFRQYHALERTGLPRLLGVQAEGAAPLVLGHAVEKPETVATAIRIGKPARAQEALDAARESRGRILAVSDEAILAAQRRLASEGIWVEPASAAGVAGVEHEVSAGRLDLKTRCLVCVCTGHGLKDPSVITKGFSQETVPAELEALADLVASS